MPVKGTKALEAVKKTTVITTYTTGVPIAPAAGHLSVYVDLATLQQHRELEVLNRLEELINRAREENYNRPSALTTLYYAMNMRDSKNKIRRTVTVGTIVEGDVAIGIDTTVLSGSRGSLLLDTCLIEIIDWMREKHRITV